MDNPSLSEITRVFLKLGTTAFGGPAAHIAMMRTEVVEKRKWISESEFLDLIGTTYLIPGPNSTELAIIIGYRLGKLKGLILAGLAFILPAFFIVLGISVLYESYGSLPDVTGMLSGMRPVIFIIVLLAIWNFNKSLRSSWESWCILIMSVVLAYFHVHELIIIFGGGIFSFLCNLRRVKLSLSVELFLFFLKVGSVLFGSGYVLIAYLERGLVQDYQWIDPVKLLDAITVGQITPGPVFTTATFIGYSIDGFSGAVFSTLGIFLPSFVFVFLVTFITNKLKNSNSFSDFLEGVNAGSIGLMVYVLYELAQKSFTNVSSVMISLISLLILLKFKSLNSVFLIAAGALYGIFF